MIADWEEKNLGHRMVSHCTTGGCHLYPVPQFSALHYLLHWDRRTGRTGAIQTRPTAGQQQWQRGSRAGGPGLEKSPWFPVLVQQAKLLDLKKTRS